MRYSVAIPQMLNDRLVGHLLQEEGQEDLCFAIWYPSGGSKRYSGLIHEEVFPVAGERNLHGNVSFNPEYLHRVLQVALKVGGGIAFMHSHVGPGWQGMSSADVKAEEYLAPRVAGATGLPLIGLTIGTDGAWSARFWNRTAPKKYKREWCETVRVIGEDYSVTYNDMLLPPPKRKEELKRTYSAWGEQTQNKLARIKVGIVGVGSVGSIVAESLARIGIQNISIIEFDTMERHNKDRSLNCYDSSVGQAKARVIASAIKKSATANNFSVSIVEYGVTEQVGYLEALNCDILFSCVDRPWPRHILNFISFAHLIPVIDGGIYARTNSSNTALVKAEWRTVTSAPGRICLECIGQYDSGMVETERSGLLEDPHYINSLPIHSALKRNENVFGFSLILTGMELQQFLSLVIKPCGVSIGPKMYRFVRGVLEDEEKCNCGPNCIFPSLIAKGDYSNIRLTGEHPLAEKERNKRKK
jgi:molybdopterin-synthase adenylyltransferase